MQKNREGPGERAVYVMYYWQGKDSKAVFNFFKKKKI